MRRHVLIVGRGRWAALAAAVMTFVAAMFVLTSAAQAVVVDPSATGTTVAYNSADTASYYGVALTPSQVSVDSWIPGSATSQLANAGVPTVTSSGPCTDPALQAGFSLPSTGLCSHDWSLNGSVVHGNETFALVWDPNPYSDYTAPYVEQFLRNVADASGSLSSPYAVTTQYTDSGGRAGNKSLYSGGYDDATGYPGNGCTPTGTWYYYGGANGYTNVPDQVCLTDAQLRPELQSLVLRNGLIGKIQPGYTPVLVLLTPPGVEDCIVSGHLCSANSDANTIPAQFCSYHAQTTVDGHVFDYVVQPFTALTACDEPGFPPLPNPITPPQLVTDMGSRLVSPLSQAQIATIVNPGLNGWFALNGDEVNDNGCAPEATGSSGGYTSLDTVPVSSTSYTLQREFNNGGVIENTPWAYMCTPNVDLGANFVVPSPIDAGDVVEFDGSKSYSSLLIPDASFKWNLGDGTKMTGPSVVHSYSKGGTYQVTLTVTDRGGNATSVSQAITVLGPGGSGGGGNGGQGNNAQGLHVHMQLMPQNLRGVVRRGITVQVSSNQAANGITSVWITRAAAKRLHLKTGRGPAVSIGTGTVSSVRKGVVTLHLWLSRSAIAKLKHASHLSLTVRMSLFSASGGHVTVDAAGNY